MHRTPFKLSLNPSLRSLLFRLKQSFSFFVLSTFFITSLGPIPAQANEFILPKPGEMAYLSPSYNPPILKGIKIHPENPFKFEFILDQGDKGDKLGTVTNFSNKNDNQKLVTVPSLSVPNLKDESTKLIKYFLASLTVPESDLWVNLSPYEKNRIIPDAFGKTEMGRDLVAQDYMLKQITASLIYPEDELGKKFWKRIYEEAQQEFGTTNIPVNTFNKVWIVPEKAVVYENAKAGTAYVVESKLKVMLEQDYLALDKNQAQTRGHHEMVFPSGGQAEEGLKGQSIQGESVPQANNTNQLGSQIVREIVIPELTKEVNEGKNFAQLRQVYNSLILATWYKKKIKDSILSQVYADKNKVKGVDYLNSLPPVGRAREGQNTDIESIYQRYLQAFKKGAYNYIKEEQDPLTHETIPRKYFSGGFDLAMRTDAAMIFTSEIPKGNTSLAQIEVNLTPMITSAAMSVREMKRALGLKPSPGKRARVLADFVEGNSRIRRLLTKSRYKLRDLDTNPHYLFYKNKIPILAISFLLGEITVWKGLKSKTYRLDNFKTPKSGIITLKDFLSLKVFGHGLEDISVENLLKNEGVLKYIRKGIPMERSGSLILDRNKNKVEFEDDFGRDFSNSAIEIRYIEDGSLQPTGIAVTRQSDMTLPDGKSCILDFHFHPGYTSPVWPSFQDMEVMIRNNTPELIINSSGRGRVWVIKDLRRARMLTASPHFRNLLDLDIGTHRDKITEKIFDSAPVDLSDKAVVAETRSKTRDSALLPQIAVHVAPQHTNEASISQAMTSNHAAEIVRTLFTPEQIRSLWRILSLSFIGHEHMDDLIPFDEGVDLNLIPTIWLPHFQQVMNHAGFIDAEAFMAAFKKGALPEDIVGLLRNPFVRNNDVSGDYTREVPSYNEEAVRRQIRQQLVSFLDKDNREQNMVIALGGTRFFEVRNVLQMLNGLLNEIARERGVTAGAIMKGKSIRVRALGIQTAHLISLMKKLEEEKVVHREWVHTEYLDLLDPWQWKRLTEQPADVFFVVNSLYLGSWSIPINHEKLVGSQAKVRNQKLRFIQYISSFVKKGGSFITERVSSNDMRVSGEEKEPSPQIPEFDPILDSTPTSPIQDIRTGVWVKPKDLAMTAAEANKERFLRDFVENNVFDEYIWSGKELGVYGIKDKRLSVRREIADAATLVKEIRSYISLREARSLNARVHQEGQGSTSATTTHGINVSAVNVVWHEKIASTHNVPVNLDGAKVALLGPGSDHEEVIEFLDQFPGIKELYVIDGNRGVLENIRNQLRDYYAHSMKQLPVIIPVLVDFTKMPKEMMTGDFDFIFESNVFDGDHFSQEHLDQVAGAVKEMLRAGGAFLSVGMYTNWVTSRFQKDGYIAQDIYRDISRSSIPMSLAVKKIESSVQLPTAEPADKAMNVSTGGIDLTANKMPLEVKREISSPQETGVRNDKEGIKFNLTPAMLTQLQNAPGFIPVIINIQPMTDLRAFLGASSA